MRTTCRAARTVADWPMGTRFRVNNIMYTKVGDGTDLNTFRVTTFKNGDEATVNLTVGVSDTVVLVRLPA
jgi:hypothetical protein